jgi:hypothetical protein
MQSESHGRVDGGCVARSNESIPHVPRDKLEAVAVRVDKFKI